MQYTLQRILSSIRRQSIYTEISLIREKINDDTLKLKKIKGTENPADMLTKVVTLEKLKLCIASTGFRLIEEKARVTRKELKFFTEIQIHI